MTALSWILVDTKLPAQFETFLKASLTPIIDATKMASVLKVSYTMVERKLTKARMITSKGI